MKKSLFTFFVFTALISSAQTIPNPGFETWTNNMETGTSYTVPQGWIPFDMLNRAFNSSYTASAVTKTTQSHTGSAAALMQTAISGGDTTSGVLISCTSFAQLVNGIFNNTGLGYGFTQRPTTLTGFFKLTAFSGDYGMVVIALTKWNSGLNKRDTIGMGTHMMTSNASSYTSFSVPLSYSVNVFPDSVTIVSGLSAANNTHVGSQFFLDDLAFSGSAPFAIEQFGSNEILGSVFPNPLSQNAVLKIDGSVVLSKAELVLMDVTGNEVRRTSVTRHETTFNGNDLAPGVYFYRVLNAGTIICSGKIVKE